MKRIFASLALIFVTWASVGAFADTYKWNPFTGTLDIVGSSTGGTAPTAANIAAIIVSGTDLFVVPAISGSTVRLNVDTAAMEAYWPALTGSSSSWTTYTKTYSDMCASTTCQITLASLGGTSVVTGVTIKHSTAFSGGSVSAMKVSVGTATAGEEEYYAGYLDVFTAVANTQSVNASGVTTGFQVDGGIGKKTYAADNLVLNVTCVGANCSAATAGSVTIKVKTETP